MADVLARFGVGDGVTPAAGLLTHLAVSGIYGLARAICSGLCVVCSLHPLG